MTDPTETIAAVASAPGGAARGIVRVSGPNAIACLERCFHPAGDRPLRDIRAPTALPGRFRLASVASEIPTDLYLWPTARSFTGQPAGELHTIGSPPLLEAMLDILCAAGARPALPGEFTLRAFLAGRLDLTRAEAVLGVVDAREEQELATALAQLAGGLATPLARLRDAMLDLLAEIEAGLDFAEEEVEMISPGDIARQLRACESAVADLAGRMTLRGETVASPRAVFIGAPNAGKSSLYNALTGQAALVSPTAGTTRDYLTARVEFDGVALQLVDTAGISADGPAGVIESAAQQAAATQRRGADIEILCLDASRPFTPADEAALAGTAHRPPETHGIGSEIRENFDPDPPPRPDFSRSQLRADAQSGQGEPIAGKRIVVLTKADCPRRAPPVPDAIITSCPTGEGLDRLRQRLRSAVLAGESGQVVASTAVRCRSTLRQAAEALAIACELLERGGGEELLAMHLRVALDELGQVVGAVYTDDILDRIFSRFCIGK